MSGLVVIGVVVGYDGEVSALTTDTFGFQHIQHKICTIVIYDTYCGDKK